MFNVSSCIDELRAINSPQGYVVEPCLGHFTGPVVATLQVSATPSFRASALAISVVSGSISNVRHGFWFEVFSSTGGYKGWWNLRAAGTLNSGTIPIRELSRASLDVVGGDILVIHAYVPLVDILPASDATFAPDQESYTNQTEVIPPMACDLGHFFGCIPEGATVATIPQSALSSYVLDSGSGGGKAYLWTVLAGPATFASGSINTDASPTFESGAGESTIILRVTDSSNSAVAYKYVYIHIYSKDDPPIDIATPFEITGSDSEGWGSQVTTYQSVPRELLADGGLVAIFTRQWINGVEQAFGTQGSGREHIKCVGYVAQDTIDMTPEGELTFTIISPLARLMNILGFGKTFIHKDTATNWQEVENLTIKLILVELARRGSWFCQNFNFRLPDTVANLLFPKAYAIKATVGAQIADFNSSIGARMVNLRTGEIQIYTFQMYMQKDARNAANTHHLSMQDMLIDGSEAPSITREHFETVELFRLKSLTAGLSGTQSVSSDYPGRALGRGPQTTANEKGIVTATNPQAANNILSGLMGAYLNKEFIDPDEKTKERAYEWRAFYPGSYDVFDFDQSFIKFDDSPANLREIDISELRHIITQIVVRYDEQGSATVEHNYHAETYAPPGEKSPPVTQNDNGLGGIGYIPDFWTPPIFEAPIYGFRKGMQRMGLILNTGIALTEDFDTPESAGGPTWVYISGSSLGLTTNIQDGISDPESPKYISGSGDTILYVVDGTKVHKLTIDNTGAISETTLYTFANLSNPGVNSSRAIDMLFAPGNIVVASYFPDQDVVKKGVYILRTSDYGANWLGETAITTNTSSEGHLVAGLSPSLSAGRYFCAAITSATGASPTFTIYTTNDGGASWSPTSLTGKGLPGTIHAKKSNESDILYGYYDTSANGHNGESRVIRNGAEVSPQLSGVKYGPHLSRAIDSCPQNGDRVVVCGRARNDGGIGNDPTIVFVSRNGGSLWTPITPPATTNGYYLVRWLGDDPNAFLLGGGGTGRVAQTLDFGGAIESKIGNLGSLTSGRTLNFFGW